MIKLESHNNGKDFRVEMGNVTKDTLKLEMVAVITSYMKLMYEEDMTIFEIEQEIKSIVESANKGFKKGAIKDAVNIVDELIKKLKEEGI